MFFCCSTLFLAVLLSELNFPRVLTSTFSVFRSKSNPQKCDFGSMDIPIPDKMNAEVGCETSSGKKELVDKEDKDTTQNQRLETSKIALESSLTREDHPSDEVLSSSDTVLFLNMF